MATLATTADCLQAFYRLLGTTTADKALIENAESADEVAYLCLTHGFRAAQRFMVGQGMANRWWKRSAALSFSSGDDGNYVALPSDFLMLDGTRHRSPLVDGGYEPWGRLIEPERDYLRGSFCFVRNSYLWLTRNNAKPTTLYLEYISIHPEVASGSTLDFPEDSRGLAVAYSGQFGLAEGWFPGGQANEAKIGRNVGFWEQQALRNARRDRGQRKITAPRSVGSVWF